MRAHRSLICPPWFYFNPYLVLPACFLLRSREGSREPQLLCTSPKKKQAPTAGSGLRIQFRVRLSVLSLEPRHSELKGHWICSADAILCVILAPVRSIPMPTSLELVASRLHKKDTVLTQPKKLRTSPSCKLACMGG